MTYSKINMSLCHVLYVELYNGIMIVKLSVKVRIFQSIQ
jgi:hypothetical protein